MAALAVVEGTTLLVAEVEVMVEEVDMVSSKSRLKLQHTNLIKVVEEEAMIARAEAEAEAVSCSLITIEGHITDPEHRLRRWRRPTLLWWWPIIW